MRAGISISQAKDAAEAGKEAAARAAADSGRPALTVLFTTDAYEPEAVLGAVKKEIGDSRLVGFCCGGLISAEGVCPQGVGVCTLGGDVRAATTLQPGLDRNPEEAGRRTGEALLASGIRRGTVIALPDGFQTNLSEMLRGLYGSMGPEYRYVGGGAGDNLKFFRTYQYTESGLASGSIAAALLDGVEISTGVGHGWVPMGDPLVVTKVQGKVLREIDGIPAFQAYQNRLGPMTKEEFRRKGMLHPLGFPDVFAQYIIRDPLTVNDDDSIQFVTEVPTQAVGNVMDGEEAALVETAERVARDAAARIEAPAFVLLFDCISRVLLMGEGFREEIRAIRNAVGMDVPLLGALSFGEIGSYEDVPLFHNKTTVVAVGGARRP